MKKSYQRLNEDIHVHSSFDDPHDEIRVSLTADDNESIASLMLVWEIRISYPKIIIDQRSWMWWAFGDGKYLFHQLAYLSDGETVSPSDVIKILNKLDYKDVTQYE